MGNTINTIESKPLAEAVIKKEEDVVVISNETKVETEKVAIKEDIVAVNNETKVEIEKVIEIKPVEIKTKKDNSLVPIYMHIADACEPYLYLSMETIQHDMNINYENYLKHNQVDREELSFLEFIYNDIISVYLIDPLLPIYVWSDEYDQCFISQSMDEIDLQKSIILNNEQPLYFTSFNQESTERLQVVC